MNSKHSVMIRDPNMRDPFESRSCPCGYRVDNGHSRVFYNLNETSVPKYECKITKGLKNHMVFPSFELLVDTTNPVCQSKVHFKNRHYAFMMQITRDISILTPLIWRRSYLGYSQYGESVLIHFYHNEKETPKTFGWNDFKLGNTLVILYAKRKTFVDGQIGIRQESLESCFIFKASIKILEKEANKLLEMKDAKELNKLEKCFNCGKEKESLSRCSKCKLALYCSKECQKESWISSHKGLCSQFDVLLRLSALPRQTFQRNFSFDPNYQSSYLPEYFFSQNYVQADLQNSS